MIFQFTSQDLVLSGNIGGVTIDEINQHAGSFNMFEKLTAQTLSQAGSFDQTWNISDDIGFKSTIFDNAQIGNEGGEGIVCDPGSGGGDFRQKCRFTGIGETHQTHIRQDFELQLNILFFTGLAVVGNSGSRPSVGFESGVAEPPVTAFGNDKSIVIVNQVTEDFSGCQIPGEGSRGNGNYNVLAVFSVFVSSQAVLPPAGLIMTLVGNIMQGGQVRIDLQDNIAAMTAIPAAGSALGTIFLPQKSNAAVTAAAGFYVDGGLVDEFHRSGAQSPAVSALISGSGCLIGLPFLFQPRFIHGLDDIVTEFSAVGTGVAPGHDQLLFELTGDIQRHLELAGMLRITDVV